MKKHRKKVIAIFAACMFAMMMMLNVSTTINESNFSIEGYTALVSGSTGGGDDCTPPNWSVCCAMWDIQVSYIGGSQTITCNSGGSLICLTC